MVISEAEEERLAGALASGEMEALGPIYDRYGGRIYSFAYSMLHNSHDAADVTSETFTAAALHIQGLRDHNKLRPWLFAIARNSALRIARSKDRLEIGNEDTELSRELAPEEAARQRDLQDTVLQVSKALEERDRLVITLHMYGDLRGKELALALGVNRAHGDVLLGRAKSRFRSTLEALLVARHGQERCPALRSVLDGWSGDFEPSIRTRVARHLKDCQECGETRNSHASAAALLVGVPALLVPDTVRATVFDADPSNARRTEAVMSFRRRDGFPAEQRNLRPVVVGAVTTGVIAGALSAGVLAASSESPESAAPASEETTAFGEAPPSSTPQTPTVDVPDGPVPPDLGLPPGIPPGSAANSPQEPGQDVATPPTSTTTLLPPSSTTTSRALSPASMTITPEVVDFGADDTTRRFTITNDGDSPLLWTASIAGPRNRWSLAPTSGTVPGHSTSNVLVTLNRVGAPRGTVSGVVTVNGAGSSDSIRLIGTIS